MRTSAMLAVAIAALMARPAMAQRPSWQLLVRSDTEAETIVDSRTIAPGDSPRQRTAIVWTLFNTPRLAGNISYRMVATLFLFDCDRPRHHLLATQAYDQPGHMVNDNRESEDWALSSPGSVVDAARLVACRQAAS